MNDLQWNRAGHDHGAVLARELGYDCLYLHYNSGLHTSINGRALADLLEVLLGQWPHRVEELAIVAHSMGGLVARSACHYGPQAGHAWPRHLRKLAFLGTPHLGAPMERGGNWVDAVAGRDALHRPVRAAGKDPQRRHHRPAPRQRARRALGGPRPLRARARHSALRASAATAWTATRWRRAPAGSAATCAIACWATESCPCAAPWACGRVRTAPCGFRSRANGSVTA